MSNQCKDCGKGLSRGAEQCRSCAVRMRWARGAFRGNSEALRAAHARGAFDGVFQSPTSIELAVAVALDICGIEHISQYRPDGHSRIYDELIPPNILIEIHGDYWHSMEKAKVRDTEKATWAEENGFTLIVIWEHEIKEQGAWSLVHERILPLLNEEMLC